MMLIAGTARRFAAPDDSLTRHRLSMYVRTVLMMNQEVAAPGHERKSRGDGDESPEFGVRNANAKCAPKFCHVSKFQETDAVKSLPTP